MNRPRGGRRPEDFPAAVIRDQIVMEYLGSVGDGPMITRNLIAKSMGTEPRLISYSLERLRSRGLVEHVPHGNEGHGYWKITEGRDHD